MIKHPNFQGTESALYAPKVIMREIQYLAKINYVGTASYSVNLH